MKTSNNCYNQSPYTVTMTETQTSVSLTIIHSWLKTKSINLDVHYGGSYDRHHVPDQDQDGH